MEIKALLLNLDTNTHILLELMLSFSPPEFPEKPEPETWSAAQIADHIIMIEMFVNKVYGSSSREADRAGDQKVKVMHDALLNSEKRFKAPDFVLPSPSGRLQAQAVKEFTEQRAAVRSHIENTDSSLLYPSFKHPMLGEMSVWEWGWFSVFHTERHIRQMQKLLPKIK
jgi:hypothetical protein